MANARLYMRECRDGGLPDVCMQCGEPAMAYKDHQFVWYPKYLLWFMLLGVLPAAIIIAVMTWRRMVTVPFCDEHRHHWLKRQLIGLGALFGTIFLIIMLFVGASLIDPQMDTLGPYAAILTLILIIAMLVVIVMVVNTQILPDEITERTITLKNVSPAFIEALEEFREEEERAYQLDRRVEERWRDRDRDRDRADLDDRRRREDDRRDRYRRSDGPEERDRDDLPRRRSRDRDD
jgi:hypothetical protein